jgi:hypothetical protein
MRELYVEYHNTETRAIPSVVTNKSDRRREKRYFHEEFLYEVSTKVVLFYAVWHHTDWKVMGPVAHVQVSDRNKRPPSRSTFRARNSSRTFKIHFSYYEKSIAISLQKELS